MNRMLIIAACGLILALIIGGTTQSREHKTTQEIFYNDKKCSDSVDIKEGECSYDTLEAEIVLADMFLRNIKRKPRMMYA